MPTYLVLFSILGALAVGVVSPGPSFVLVARTAIAGSRRAGVWAAVGMGLGGVCFAILALVGLRAVLDQVPALSLLLKGAGGLYLAYLGWCIWRGASTPLTMSPTTGGRPHRAFILGLTTQLSNPKTAVVYASIFAALLPAQASSWLPLALLPGIFLVETGWYSLVAMAFSAGRPRAAYLRAKCAIDRLAGAVMGGLGARLVWEGAIGVIRPS